jgi:hypothetical protein
MLPDRLISPSRPSGVNAKRRHRTCRAHFTSTTAALLRIFLATPGKDASIMSCITDVTACSLPISATDRERLLENGAHAAAGDDIDPFPVLKLFTPDAGATWLLTEIDPDDPEIAFGLCDLGLGTPELGYVALGELATLRGRLGLPVERDLNFQPDRPLSRYAHEARARGRIIT